MRRRTLLEDKNGGNGVVDGSKAAPMSVVFANKNDGSLSIVEGDKWSTSSYPVSTFVPIGIVVIPGEHGVLKDAEGRNQCGVMSIVGMRVNSPTNGGDDSTMCWGSITTNPTGRYYEKVVVTSNNISNIATGLSSSYLAYIPRQGLVSSTPTRNQSPYAPSPYVGDDYKSGDFNPSYSQTTSPSSTANCLSDFDGRGNTDNILEERGTKDYTNWKPTYDNTSDYPAASCCDMFYTIGTKQGDWYLPAAGELGYITPRLYDINDTIGKLNNDYKSGIKLNTSGNYWSSSESSSFDARRVNMGNGRIDHGSKNGSIYVRAFMRL